MRPSPTRIGHVGIAVRDLDRSVRFYCEVLGLALTERFEYPEEQVGHGVAVAAGAFVRCSPTHHCLSIFAYKHGIANEVDGFQYGLHHIAFELPTPDDLLRLYRQVRDAGVKIVNARKGGPGNQPRFYVQDPDGNLLEFYWGIDQIGWSGVPRRYDPIAEIDLEAFDFDAYLERRTAEADVARAAAGRAG